MAVIDPRRHVGTAVRTEPLCHREVVHPEPVSIRVRHRLPVPRIERARRYRVDADDLVTRPALAVHPLVLVADRHRFAALVVPEVEFEGTDVRTRTQHAGANELIDAKPAERQAVPLVGPFDVLLLAEFVEVVRHLPAVRHADSVHQRREPAGTVRAVSDDRSEVRDDSEARLVSDRFECPIVEFDVCGWPFCHGIDFTTEKENCAAVDTSERLQEWRGSSRNRSRHPVQRHQHRVAVRRVGTPAYEPTRRCLK